ncbi:MAG: FAD-binding protein [Anaerolineae bacterium]|nr:FAD-binding protein [Anaerolineae bacterium]
MRTFTATVNVPDIPKMMTEEYHDLLEQCVHCGLCLEACPTYAVFGTEMDAPRGRIALMRAAVNGKIDQQAFLTTFAEHITLCLECRACETACPSGVQYGKLIEGARIALEDLRSPGIGERLARWAGMAQLMPHVGQMKLLARLMALYQALGLQTLVRTVNVLPKPLNAMEGILPPITTRFTDTSKPAPAIGERRGTVAFFYGCIQEAFLAGVNAATIRVLQRNGYEVHFPQAQTCCGAAQWHTGAESLAKDLARRNIEAFAPYDVVVNNAGGCGATLKEYPDLLRDDPEYAERATAFAAKVQDFSEFAYPHLHKPPRGTLRVRATYSDSCHLRHGQGVIDQPRELLRGIDGLTLIELKHPDRCCGSAGIYNIVQSETANAVLDAKMAEIAATGADIIVTSNTGCHMQLVAGVRRWRLNAKVLHIAEMLDLAYLAEERQGGAAQTPSALKPAAQPQSGRVAGRRNTWSPRRERVARLDAPVRHPKPLLPAPKLPERWLGWQAKRLARARRDGAQLSSLKAVLQPGQIVDDPVELLTYLGDGGLDQGVPIGVAFPYTTLDVQSVVSWGAEHGVPVVARGAGTGLAGGAVALRGGLLLQFSHMKQLLDLDVTGRSAVVQPGIVNLTLDEIVKGEGLYFPPDPASGRAATIGGNIGANAGGPHCFKYGVMTNYVTGLEVVLADGRRVKLGGRALDAPGLDLVGLFTGAEGTLGVVTEAEVRLVRNPPATKTLLAAFDSVEQAGEAVSAVIAAGLVPATMEMMCQKMMRLVEDYTHPGLPVEAGAVLIIDMDGYPESLGAQIDEVVAVLSAHRAVELRVAKSEAERTQIWYARKSAAGALARVALDHYTVDGSVPRSKLGETLREVIKICDDLDLPVVFLVHAGDGNLHPMVLVQDPNDAEFLARLHEGGRRMAALFVSLGGTITGEHGVGIEKQEFMALMYGEEELAAMHEIKALFDPTQQLNPDKVFPKGQTYGACTLIDEAHPLDVTSHVVTPASAEEVSAAICGLSAAGRRIRVRGSGAKSLDLPVDGVVLSSAALAGIRTYARDDLYVTVGAGTRLADLQAALAPDGMWVPLVSPWPEATIGGIVSTALNAPLRMRYGGIRDLVQALHVVLPDGRALYVGRPVMKNVAGYDLVKLFVGSHGSLGMLTDVTFKLMARPRQSQTLSVVVPSWVEGLRWAGMLSEAALVASAVLVGQKPDARDGLSLWYTAEGLPEDVEAELAGVRAILQRAGAPEPDMISTDGNALWARWVGAGFFGPEDLLMRVGVAPKDFTTAARAILPELGRACMLADTPNGHLYLRGGFDLTRVRAAARALGGYAVVLGAAQLGVDVWGDAPDGLDLMRAIKAQWDPMGGFNEGAFVV